MPVKPREPMTVGPADMPVTLPAHVRVERYGRGRGRIFVDGQHFPWTTSPTVEPQVTSSSDGITVDVTFAIRAFGAEIVCVDTPKSETDA